MEIKVEKDMKTGESTVLSTIPLPSEEFKGAGVKVYDDGRKSVYAVCTNGGITNNEVDDLAPVEVEDLLRQATEKQSKSPTEYHEPVYANQFCRPTTPQQEKLTQAPNGEDASQNKAHILDYCSDPFYNNAKGQKLEDNSLSKSSQENSHYPVPQQTERLVQISPPNKMVPNVPKQVIQDAFEPVQKTRENQHDVPFRNSTNTNERSFPAAPSNEDSSYTVVHAMPCYVDDNEPVTMIFMGYQHVEDEELNKTVCGYDGLIHAELVVIDDDGEEEDSTPEKPLYHPVGPSSQVYQPPNQTAALPQRNPSKATGENVNKSPHKNSISLKEQEESLGSSTYSAQLDGQLPGDGTEDPSLTGKKPGKSRRCCTVM